MHVLLEPVREKKSSRFRMHLRKRDYRTGSGGAQDSQDGQESDPHVDKKILV